MKSFLVISLASCGCRSNWEEAPEPLPDEIAYIGFGTEPVMNPELGDVNGGRFGKHTCHAVGVVLAPVGPVSMGVLVRVIRSKHEDPGDCSVGTLLIFTRHELDEMVEYERHLREKARKAEELRREVRELIDAQ